MNSPLISNQVAQRLKVDQRNRSTHGNQNKKIKIKKKRKALVTKLKLRFQIVKKRTKKKKERQTVTLTTINRAGQQVKSPFETSINAAASRCHHTHAV